MNWDEVFEIFPLEDDMNHGAIVGWHVIGVMDRVNYTTPEVLPYGYANRLQAEARARMLHFKLHNEVDEVLLNDKT